MEAAPLNSSDRHRFCHDAMKTTFSLRFIHKDAAYTAQLASHCIEIIDRIEQHLSRYLPASEISQINQLTAGETLILSELCYDCLQQGFQAYQETGGRFDITLGHEIDGAKSGKLEPRLEVNQGQFALDPDRPQIYCIRPGKLIDLGGIGKGFALDQLHASLNSLNYNGSALLSAGASTHLAIGDEKWLIQLKGQYINSKLSLHKAAISASGIAEQGQHIVSKFDPHLQVIHPRIWFIAKNACDADIWSTTAMLMTHNECQSLIDEGYPLIIDGKNGNRWLKNNA